MKDSAADEDEELENTLGHRRRRFGSVKKMASAASSGLKKVASSVRTAVKKVGNAVVNAAEKAGQDEDLEDELNMVSKAAVAAHKHHWHHRHHPKKPKWGKPPKKHLHHRHRPHVHVPKAGQDEDLEDKPNMAD